MVTYISHRYIIHQEKTNIFFHKKRKFKNINIFILSKFHYTYDIGCSFWFHVPIQINSTNTFMENLRPYITQFSNKPKFYWKYSFFIYCTHFFVINIVQKLLYLLLGNSNIDYLIIYISTPIIVLPVCILIAKTLDNKTNFIYKIITGNR